MFAIVITYPVQFFGLFFFVRVLSLCERHPHSFLKTFRFVLIQLNYFFITILFCQSVHFIDPICITFFNDEFFKKFFNSSIKIFFIYYISRMKSTLSSGFFLFNNSVKRLLTKLFLSAVSNNFAYLLEEIRIFQKKISSFWALSVFHGTVHPILEKYSIMTTINL